MSDASAAGRASQAAVADIPRERSTESSDAPCELRAESVLPPHAAVATFVSFWQCVTSVRGRLGKLSFRIRLSQPLSSRLTQTAKRTKRALSICENCQEGCIILSARRT